jgi:hypothetical protein
MDTPTTLKGHFYPSSRVSRCIRFHACTVTKKCQNFDRHLQECNLCESRTNTHEVDPDSVPLGGHLPEGEYYPDLQDAFAQLEKLIHKPFAHPDAETQNFNSVDIARNWEREHRITETIRHFSSVGALSMDENIMQALVDPELAALLGRMEN